MVINSLETLKTALENGEHGDERVATGSLDPEWYLPTFGGKRPADTSGTYSWDEARLLIENPDTGKLEIVRR